MSKKRNRSTVDDAVKDLGHNPSKATVQRALGKEPRTFPNSGPGKTTRVKPPISIQRPHFVMFDVVVREMEGSPLIVHAWGRKAIHQMLGDHMGYTMELEDKRPFEDFVECLYSDKRTGELTLRSVMFKNSMIEALRHLRPARKEEEVRKMDAGEGITIVGEMSPLYGFPTNRLDPVKVGNFPNTTADLRFRPEFVQWAAVLRFRHNPDVITKESILNLLIMAGEMVGVGEWRPGRKGPNGLFQVVGAPKQAEEVLQALGRHKVSDLTPDNTCTTALLREYRLDEDSLAMLSRKVNAAVGDESSNGVTDAGA